MALPIADAKTLKSALAVTVDQVKTWHSLTFATVQDAVTFVNLAPAQGAGEFGFSYRPDGQVDAIYFL
ncbi:hypothetical protein [Kitasatospora sp. NPDC088351]|uniref:hypothetical protein n=1 Tax=unclassified Kitasatospora TaxID=2633591 RepID=UPI0034385422